MMLILKKTVLLFSLCLGSFSVFLFQNANALETQHNSGNQHKIDPVLIRYCVNQLLYERVFPSGNPAGDRTIIDPASAALACRGVQSQHESLEVKKCVNGLLYETIFQSGNPAGERTIIDPASAARACSICKSS